MGHVVIVCRRCDMDEIHYEALQLDEEGLDEKKLEAKAQRGSWNDAAKVAKLALLASGWAYPAMLLLSAVAYEIASSFIIYATSNFYLSISSQDLNLFVNVLWRSMLVVTLVAICRTVRDYASEASALVWRSGLVKYLHTLYLQGVKPFEISHDAAHSMVDNPDQRIAVETDTACTAIGEVLKGALIVPLLLMYYTWYLTSLFGWVAPAVCYLYIILGSLANAYLLQKVVPLVAALERCEGKFRYGHAWLRTNAEAIAFYGEDAVEGPESKRLNGLLDEVISSKWRVLCNHLPLYFCKHELTYMGAIVNYAVVRRASPYCTLFV